MARKQKTRKPYQSRYERPRVDPIVREVADAISRMSAREIANKSWVSPSTFYRIKNGKTNRPQNLTIEGLLHAAGFSRMIVRSNEPMPEYTLRKKKKKGEVEYL